MKKSKSTVPQKEQRETPAIQESPSKKTSLLSDDVIGQVAIIMKEQWLDINEIILQLRGLDLSKKQIKKFPVLLEKYKNKAREVLEDEARKEIDRINSDTNSKTIEELYSMLIGTRRSEEYEWAHLLYAKAYLKELLEISVNDEEYLESLKKVMGYINWKAQKLFIKAYLVKLEDFKEKPEQCIEKLIRIMGSYLELPCKELIAKKIIIYLDEMNLPINEYYIKIHKASRYIWESRDLLEKKAVDLVPKIISKLDTLKPNKALIILDSLINDWESPANQALIAYRDFITNRKHIEAVISSDTTTKKFTKKEGLELWDDIV